MNKIALTHLNLLRPSASISPEGPEVQPFTKLRVLDLHCNGLTSIPPAIKFCAVNLCDLILHSNELTALPDEVADLTGLRTLDVHDNKASGAPQFAAVFEPPPPPPQLHFSGGHC